MEFTRRRAHGRSATTYKEWMDDEGRGYMIQWRGEYESRYYALVETIRPGGVWLNFAWDRRPYRTLTAAEKACDKHFRKWRKYVDLGGAKGKIRRATELLSEPVMHFLPAWVNRVAHPSLVELWHDHYGTGSSDRTIEPAASGGLRADRERTAPRGSTVP